MTVRVHVVDYGVGNLYSVARAVEKAGAEVVLTENRAEIATADRLILPGVGAFRDGMAGLAARGLDDAVRRFAATERPLLGICLGMQMLASESAEFGNYVGLDLIPGRVVPIPRLGADGTPHKVPFIGWAALNPTRAEGFVGTPLEKVEGDSVYLVHSYHLEPEADTDLLAVYNYDGLAITAATRRHNVFGCQFHPEKSGPTGLGIIASFLSS